MPVPEQSPVTEEGLLLTIRNRSTGHSMEADNTANNILASVKEQVRGFFSVHAVERAQWFMLQLSYYDPVKAFMNHFYTVTIVKP